MKEIKAAGAIAGAGVAALVQLDRLNEDTKRRADNAQGDAADALGQLRALSVRGEVIRSRLPIVQDAQVGLALAQPQQSLPALVPTTAPAQRPDLTQTLLTIVRALTWPPRLGEYNAQGMSIRAGDMTLVSLVQTYPEVAAFLLGLAQPATLPAESQAQIALAANGLTSVLAGLNLTASQYLAAWARLFAGVSFSSGHEDPGAPPVIVAGSIAAGLVSAQALTSAAISGYPYANPQTDRAHRWRLVVGGVNIVAGIPLFTVRFGTSYQYRNSNGALVALQPSVQTNQAVFVQAGNITSDTYTLVATGVLLANATYDVFVSTDAGVVTEA